MKYLVKPNDPISKNGDCGIGCGCFGQGTNICTPVCSPVCNLCTSKCNKNCPTKCYRTIPYSVTERH